MLERRQALRWLNEMSVAGEEGCGVTLPSEKQFGYYHGATHYRLKSELAT